MNHLKDILRAIEAFIPPIHKEGHIFILIFAIASLLFGMLWDPLGWIGLIVTVWCMAFFRDPKRVIPEGDNLLISPADGLVQKVEKAQLPAELGIGDDEVWRVSIFLNIFNVHINRVPLSGEVTHLNYHPGKFMSAELDKASDENERQSVVVKTKDDKQVVFVQIAGLIARRIVCDLQEGQQVNRGERYGLIRFGSRCDIYLPKGVAPLVVTGQTAIGGETILADSAQESDETRQGETI